MYTNGGCTSPEGQVRCSSAQQQPTVRREHASVTANREHRLRQFCKRSNQYETRYQDDVGGQSTSCELACRGALHARSANAALDRLYNWAWRLGRRVGTCHTSNERLGRKRPLPSLSEP